MSKVEQQKYLNLISKNILILFFINIDQQIEN